jgi:hypothetical protein
MTGLSGKCPSCNGDELIWGTILLPMNETLRFMPHSLPGRFTGFPVEAFACRSCGYVGLHLSLEQRKNSSRLPFPRRVFLDSPEGMSGY